MLTVSDVAGRLGISAGTVRNYTSQFADHLSPEATPPPGQPRRFTDEDLRVMATAKSLLAEGLTYDQVRERLAEGVHLVEEVEVPPTPEPEPERTETALVPVATLQLYVQPYVRERDRVIMERDEALARVAELEREVGRLEGQLQVQQPPGGKSWIQRLLGR